MIVSEAFVEFDLSYRSFVTFHFFQGIETNSKGIVDILDSLFFSLVLILLNVLDESVEAVTYSEEVCMK